MFLENKKKFKKISPHLQYMVIFVFLSIMSIFQFQNTSAELYPLDIEVLAKMIADPFFLFLCFSLELCDTYLHTAARKFPSICKIQSHVLR